MKTVNWPALPEEGGGQSPGGKFQSYCRNVSQELGARASLDEPGEDHPFDLQIRRIPPGKAVCPCHAHARQWELFIVLQGRGLVRRNGESFSVQAGDTFIHPPGTAHQLSNPSASDDLVVQIIANNPTADHTHYPDSGKWQMKPGAKIFRMNEAGYFDGEE